MAKKAQKKKNKNRPNRPNLSPLTMLRPRLDGLINNPGWTDKEDEEIMADLNAVVRGIEAADYLPVLLRAVQSAPEIVHESLNRLLPGWIDTNQNKDVFLMLLEEESIAHENIDLAKAWLMQMGVEQERLNKEQDSTFCDAYFGIDGFPSQAFLIILWYHNRTRSKVRGINFLIDFNPPWEGSIKDGFVLPQRSHRDAIHEFVDIWDERELTITQLDGAEAKAKFIEAIYHNQEANVRIHRDIANVRELIIKHIFSLPDLEETPSLTVADFDAVCKKGQRAEQAMFVEQNFGRRIRTEDGKEVVVVGDPWDEDEY
ncbi:MAG: hypothetical protein AAF702_32070 [Chloroflexota bacterium]